MRFLRQSTATVVEVGPFVDETDGKTLEEALTVASIDVQLMQPLDTAAVPPDLIQNGDMASSAGWTENSWTIGSGVATSAAAQDTNLDQTVAITENKAYELTITTTRSAGGVLPILGTTNGTLRSTASTFTEIIIAGSGSLIRFDAQGFTGTLDDVILKQVPIPITPAASGSANDMVLTQSNTGTYWLELTAAQLGIVGRHKLTAFISGALIVWEEFMVVEEAVYDQLYAAAATGAATVAALSTAQADLDTITGTSGVLIGTDAANVTEISDAVWDESAAAHSVAGSFGQSIEDVLLDTDTTVPGLIATAQADLDTITGTSGVLIGTDAANVTEISDAVWDEAISGHSAPGSFGQELEDVLADTNELQADDYPTSIAALQTDLDTITGDLDDAGRLDVIFDAILADTNELQGDNVPGLIATAQSDLDTITGTSGVLIGTDAANVTEISDAVWDEDATGHQTGGTFGQAIGDPGANAETMYDAVVTDAAGTNVAADIIVIESQTDDIGVAGAGLTDLGGMSTGMKGEVNVEALDVLNTDTFAEPGQGTPGATVTLAAKIGYLYKFLRNRVTSTATEISVYNDDATTVGQKSTHSDDATTYDRGEFTTGA